MLSFSTCWCRKRHRSGEAMAEELLEMGIHTIELGHGLPITLLEGLVRVVERGDLRVSSVHNFCPHPLEVRGSSPNCYRFTSHRESDRQRAVRLTRQTLEIAQRVGAPLVVLHGGQVHPAIFHQQAIAWLEKGKLLSKEYGHFKVQAVPQREKVGPHFVQRLREALWEVLPLAESYGITLALENQERYEDVPSEREFPQLLEEFEHLHLGYWHDFGHAQIKQNLAFLHHGQWLEKIGPQVVGCHVHDVIWPLSDHQLPFTGEVPFDQLLPLLPPSIPLVWEISPHVSKEDVVKAWKMWQERYPA